MKKCPICEINFTPFGAQKYCSVECEKVAKHMMDAYITPSNLYPPLNNEHKQILEQIAKRQQDASMLPQKRQASPCVVCGSTTKMALHHVSYIPEEKIVLCYRCHALLHSSFLKGKRVRPLESWRAKSV